MSKRTVNDGVCNDAEKYARRKKGWEQLRIQGRGRHLHNDAGGGEGEPLSNKGGLKFLSGSNTQDSRSYRKGGIEVGGVCFKGGAGGNPKKRAFGKNNAFAKVEEQQGKPLWGRFKVSRKRATQRSK